MREDELQILGVKREKKKRKIWIVAIASMVVLAALIFVWQKIGKAEQQQETQEMISTIVPELQTSVDSLLNNALTQISGLHGQVIVMEVKTGEIKAMSGLERRYDGKYHPCNLFGYQQELGPLMHTVSLLAALETGEVDLHTKVDTGNGIWPTDENHVIRDHNWQRGGYGTTLVGLALEFSSNIGIAKAVQKAYLNNAQGFFNKLDKMSFGQPDSIEGIAGLRPAIYSSPKDSDWVNRLLFDHAIGYERKMAPIQMLTFYNAIANDGKMVKPTLKRGKTEVINEQIASQENIKEMQWILRRVVSEGLGKRAGSTKTAVAGKMGTSQVNIVYGDEDDGVCEYELGFCGYFPAGAPKYSMIVSINMIWGPRSAGLIAGTAFWKITEWMCDNGYLKD